MEQRPQHTIAEAAVELLANDRRQVESRTDRLLARIDDDARIMMSLLAAPAQPDPTLVV